MDRRAFVLGVLGVAAASTVLSVGEAEAAFPVLKPEGSSEAERLESDFRPEVDGEAKPEKAQFYYYRPRRVYYRRRFRRRRVYFVRRRRFRRRRYYRRVYYW